MAERYVLVARKEQLRALGIKICEGQPARVAAWRTADEALRAIIDASPMDPTDAEFLAAEVSVKAQCEVIRAKRLVEQILARMASLTARIAQHPTGDTP